MKIALANMFYSCNPRNSIGEPVEWTDVGKFVEQNSYKRLAFNLANKWCWDVSGRYPGFESDGPCVFVSWEP